MENYIQIKEQKIPVQIRNYRYSKMIKFYFRGNTLHISKPKRLSNRELEKMLKKHEDYLYFEYLKIQSLDNTFIKHWVTGEKIYFKGEEFKIVINEHKLKRIKIYINEESKEFQIDISKEINDLNKIERKKIIDKAVKKVLKEETYSLLEKRLEIWSEFTNLKYNSFKVADAISKYGSCIPKTKNLHFSSRLIMLPIEEIDSVIVHELCHLVHANHSNDFYNLVRSFMPDYDERNKWLKKNNKILAI